MAEKWYKLDNAAKIFPAISSNDGSNYYRTCAILKEDIQVDLLKEALQSALARFPMYAVKLRCGIFWYYFEHNEGKPLIRKENPILFDSVNTDEHNRFMFVLEYYGKRLSLEMFHALSDGTGGMEFFKTILYYYLTLCSYPITNDGSILTNEYEQLTNESMDSFVYNYDKNSKQKIKEQKAYKMKGTLYKDNWVGVLHMMMSVSEIKALAHRYQATITEYLGSILVYVMYQSYQDKKRRPIQLFVPVNARKLFASKSLRNFMLYIRTSLRMDQDKSYTFEEIIELVKQGFKEELSKEKLTSRLVSNVRIERNFLIRILPLFIKKIALNLSYKAYGSNLNSISFSNLGVIQVPSSFYPYVEQMYFMIGVSSDGPINVAASSYQDTLTLTFTSRIMERELQKEFVRFLSEKGVQIVVETNDLEVEV